MTTSTKLTDACSLEENLWQTDSTLKRRGIVLLTKFCIIKAVFCSIHVGIWDLEHKESYVPKNWCFQMVVLERTLESPLDCKEIQPVTPQGNQSWIPTGRTHAETNNLATWCEVLTADAVKDWEKGREG